MTDPSPHQKRQDKVATWTIVGSAAAVVSVLIALVALFLPQSPATSSETPSGSGPTDVPDTPSATSSPAAPITTTTTNPPKSKQWVDQYREVPLHLQDSVVIDFDTSPLPTVKTDDFPGGDLNFSFTGSTWSDEPVVLSVHDGPNATAESCAQSLQLGPTTRTYISDDAPYMCVSTSEGAIGFITVLETITDYRITVTLWVLA